MGSLVVGAYSEAWGNACVALGFECGAGGPYLFPPALDAGIAIGCQSNVYADQAIAIGKSADAWWAGASRLVLAPWSWMLLIRRLRGVGFHFYCHRHVFDSHGTGSGWRFDHWSG